MITTLERMTGEGGTALLTVTVDKMIATEQDLGKKKEEEEVLKDLHNQGHIMVPGREATDQLQQAEPKEALPEEDSEGHIQEEGLTENTPEAVITSPDQEKDTEISNHHTIKKDLQVIPETVIMAEMGRGKTEMEEKEEALIEVQARKERATEKETMIEEEREEVKNKKTKRASLDASVADQRITWPPNAQYTNLDPHQSVVSVNLITPPPNVEPGASLTTLS